MKKINHWFLILLIYHITNVLEVSAQVPCKSENLTEYLEIVRTEKEEFRLKSAADCITKLAPSKETAQVLMNRLDHTLREARNLKPDDNSFSQAEIVAGIAEALYVMKNKEGYKMIEDYFIHANWNTWRDQWFFEGIATHGYYRSELTETFYLAINRLPATAGNHLSRACSVFHRIGDSWVVRDEPRFIYGVLSALSRLELEKRIPKENYVKKSCEETLLSQLLDEKMRRGFLTSFQEKLSVDEGRILDRFLTKIARPHEADIVGQFSKAFFSIPWKEKLSIWQKNNSEIPCETFHGESYVTHADDLWCSLCSLKEGTLEKTYYFYPDMKGKTCTLQKIRFTYPSASKETLKTLTNELAEKMGPGSPVPRAHDFGSAYWEGIFFWNWQGREVYDFFNNDDARTGKGLPKVEILAREEELISVMKQEEMAEKAILKGKEQREKIKEERLYIDISKSLPNITWPRKKVSDPEIQYSLLLELLSKMAPNGPDRAVQLYLADRLAFELGWEVNIKKLHDWEKKRQALLAYGVIYSPGHEGLDYNQVFLKKIIEEGLQGYWAEEAFLYWQLMGWVGWDEKKFCEETDMFKMVISKGEDFLKKNSASHIRKEILLSLAQAHETGWSLSLASPKDGYAEAKNYQAEASEHRSKAILYYEQFMQEYPDSKETVISRAKLKRLRLGIDTNSRKFYCIFN